MDDNLRVFRYSQPKSKISEIKKRESNPFFLFRDKIRETAPKNIKMTELSKIASNLWKNLSEGEKAEWKSRAEWKSKAEWKSRAECKRPYEKTNRASPSHQIDQQTTSTNGQDVGSTTVNVPHAV